MVAWEPLIRWGNGGAWKVGQRSVMFDLGLTTLGLLWILPGVRWFWPFSETSREGMWPVVASLAISFVAVRVINEMANGIESEVVRAVKWIGGQRRRHQNT